MYSFDVNVEELCKEYLYFELFLFTTANFKHSIPSFQLDKFRSLEDSDGNTLSHNFRPVQPIGDRIVWQTSDKFTNDDDNIHDKIHGKKKGKNSALMNRGNFSFLVFLSICVGAIKALIFNNSLH